MSKRTANMNKKLFSFDLESLFLGELSQDRNDGESSVTDSTTKPKKFKFKGKKSEVKTKKGDEFNETDTKEDLNEVDYVNDVSKFFENVGNDFSKSMQTKKLRLGRFSESVISLYQTKVIEMLKKQETEMVEFKNQAAANIEDEMNKFQEEMKKLKLQETKLIKFLEQQVKIMQKSWGIQEQWVETFSNLHQNFLQEYRDLTNKHKAEASDLKKSLETEVSGLQNKFLMESKREEMQVMKNYISSVYF